MKSGWICICMVSVVTLFSACGLLTRTYQPPKPIRPILPTDVGYVKDGEALYYYSEAIKAMMLSGNIEETEKLLYKVLEIDSTYSAALYKLANIYQTKNPTKALEYSRRAHKSDSSNIWIKSTLGQSLIGADQYKEAEGVYEELLKDMPQEPNNYRILAALYYQNNSPYTAISTLDSADYKLGRTEELSPYKILLLKELRLYKRAIDETKKLIEIYPYSFKNYISLAELYAETHQDSLANINYKKATSIAPNNIELLLSMQTYYKTTNKESDLLQTTKKIFNNNNIKLSAKIGMYNEFISDNMFYRRNVFRVNELASTLLINYPNDTDVAKLYATNLIYQGNLDGALALYKSRIKPDSTPIAIFKEILDIEAYKNRSDSIEYYSRIALAQHPNNTNLILRRGGLFVYMKEIPKAIKEYEIAIKSTSNDSIRSMIEGIIGDIYFNDGDSKKAYKQYKKALKLNKNNIIVLNNYAYFLSEANENLELALEMSTRVIKLESSNATFLDTYGWILHKLGKNTEAKKIIQQAISLDRTNNDEIFLHYGDILDRLNEEFMARIYWRKALEAGTKTEVIEKRLEMQKNKNKK